MSIDQRLRETLADLPEPPTEPGYGDRLAALGRRRRARRAAVTTGAGVLAVVLTVATVTRGAGPDRPGPGDPVTEPAAPAVVDDLDCSAPVSDAVDGAPVVPTGAVAARLCGGQVDNAGIDVRWPADTLRGRFVDRLVTRLNAMAPYEEQEYCGLIAGPSYDLVLVYPDGAQVRVTASTAGNCAHLGGTGGPQWRDPGPVLDEARRLVREQRDGADAPAVAAACPPQWQDVWETAGAIPVGLDDPVAVTACRYDLRLRARFIDESAHGALRDEVVVGDPDPLVRVALDGSRTDPCGGVAYDLDPTQDLLIVVDRWGDRHVVPTNAPCWPSTLSGPRRYPAETLAQEVAALLS